MVKIDDLMNLTGIQGAEYSRPSNLDVDAYTPYLGDTVYDENPYLDDYRADEQSIGQQSLRTVLNLPLNVLGGVIENAGHIFDGFGQAADLITNGEDATLDYESAITKAGQNMHNATLGEVYQRAGGSFNPTSSGWWFNTGGGLIESIAEFYITGLGVGKALNYGASKAFGVNLNKLNANLAKSAQQAAKLRTVDPFINTLKNMTAAQRYAQGLSMIGTAGTLAYVEGAMSGNEIYKSTKEKFKEYNGFLYNSEEELEKDANKVASSAAAKTVKLNTAINTLLNISSVAPIFGRKALKPWQKVTDEVDDAVGAAVKKHTVNGKVNYKELTKELSSIPGDIKKQSLKKILGSEMIQEGLEEVVNVGAENVGKQSAGLYATNSKESVGNFFDAAISSDGLLNFALGAIGGAGQTTLMHTIPTTKMPQIDPKTNRYQKGEDGKIVTKRMNSLNAEQELKRRRAESMVKAFTTDIENIEKHLQGYKVQKAIGNDEAALNHMLNARNIAFLQSIKKGTSKYFKDLYTALKSTDNANPIKQEFLDEIKGLEEEKSKLDPEQEAETIKVYDETIAKLQEKADTLTDETEAVDLGLAKDGQDNEYTRRLTEAIEDLEVLEKHSEALQNLLDPNNAYEEQYTSYFLGLKAQQLGNRRTLEQLREGKALLEATEINDFDNYDLSNLNLNEAIDAAANYYGALDVLDRIQSFKDLHEEALAEKDEEKKAKMLENIKVIMDLNTDGVESTDEALGKRIQDRLDKQQAKADAFLDTINEFKNELTRQNLENVYDEEGNEIEGAAERNQLKADEILEKAKLYFSSKGQLNNELTKYADQIQQTEEQASYLNDLFNEFAKENNKAGFLENAEKIADRVAQRRAEEQKAQEERERKNEEERKKKEEEEEIAQADREKKEREAAEKQAKEEAERQTEQEAEQAQDAQDEAIDETETTEEALQKQITALLAEKATKLAQLDAQRKALEEEIANDNIAELEKELEALEALIQDALEKKAEQKEAENSADPVTENENVNNTNEILEASYSQIALDYLLTGGKGTILSTDYLLQALVAAFPNVGVEINILRNNYLNKLGNIKDDLNSESYNKIVNELKKIVQNSYGEKGLSILNKILKNPTGFTTKEGKLVEKELESLDKDVQNKSESTAISADINLNAKIAEIEKARQAELQAISAEMENMTEEEQQNTAEARIKKRVKVNEKYDKQLDDLGVVPETIVENKNAEQEEQAQEEQETIEVQKQEATIEQVVQETLDEEEQQIVNEAAKSEGKSVGQYVIDTASALQAGIKTLSGKLEAAFDKLLTTLRKTFFIGGFFFAAGLFSFNSQQAQFTPIQYINQSGEVNIENIVASHKAVNPENSAVIVDKQNRTAYVYGKDGELIYKKDIVIGADKGDVRPTEKLKSVPYSQKAYADAKTRITPSGVFEGKTVDRTTYGTDKIVILLGTKVERTNGTSSSVAFHANLSVREKFIDNGTTADNAVSMACIGANKSDFDDFEEKLTDNVDFYIIPETNTRAVFSQYLNEKFAGSEETYEDFLIRNRLAQEQKTQENTNKKETKSNLAGLGLLILGLRKKTKKGETLNQSEIDEMQTRVAGLKTQIAALNANSKAEIASQFNDVFNNFNALKKERLAQIKKEIAETEKQYDKRIEALERQKAQLEEESEFEFGKVNKKAQKIIQNSEKVEGDDVDFEQPINVAERIAQREKELPVYLSLEPAKNKNASKLISLVDALTDRLSENEDGEGVINTNNEETNKPLSESDKLRYAADLLDVVNELLKTDYPHLSPNLLTSHVSVMLANGVDRVKLGQAMPYYQMAIEKTGALNLDENKNFNYTEYLSKITAAEARNVILNTAESSSLPTESEFAEIDKKALLHSGHFKVISGLDLQSMNTGASIAFLTKKYRYVRGVKVTDTNVLEQYTNHKILLPDYLNEGDEVILSHITAEEINDFPEVVQKQWKAAKNETDKPIVIRLGDELVGYLHTLDWVLSNTGTNFGKDPQNIAYQAAVNQALREKVFNEGKVSLKIANVGEGWLSRRVPKSGNILNLNDRSMLQSSTILDSANTFVTFAQSETNLVKTGNKKHDAIIDEIYSENFKPGRAYALVPGKLGYRYAPLFSNKIKQIRNIPPLIQKAINQYNQTAEIPFVFDNVDVSGFDLDAMPASIKAAIDAYNKTADKPFSSSAVNIDLATSMVNAIELHFKGESAEFTIGGEIYNINTLAGITKYLETFIYSIGGGKKKLTNESFNTGKRKTAMFSVSKSTDKTGKETVSIDFVPANSIQAYNYSINSNSNSAIKAKLLRAFQHSYLRFSTDELRTEGQFTFPLFSETQLETTLTYDSYQDYIRQSTFTNLQPHKVTEDRWAYIEQPHFGLELPSQAEIENAAYTLGIRDKVNIFDRETETSDSGNRLVKDGDTKIDAQRVERRVQANRQEAQKVIEKLNKKVQTANNSITDLAINSASALEKEFKNREKVSNRINIVQKTLDELKEKYSNKKEKQILDSINESKLQLENLKEIAAQANETIEWKLIDALGNLDPTTLEGKVGKDGDIKPFYTKKDGISLDQFVTDFIADNPEMENADPTELTDMIYTMLSKTKSEQRQELKKVSKISTVTSTIKQLEDELAEEIANKTGALSEQTNYDKITKELEAYQLELEKIDERIFNIKQKYQENDAKKQEERANLIKEIKSLQSVVSLSKAVSASTQLLNNDKALLVTRYSTPAGVIDEIQDGETLKLYVIVYDSNGKPRTSEQERKVITKLYNNLAEYEDAIRTEINLSTKHSENVYEEITETEDTLTEEQQEAESVADAIGEILKENPTEIKDTSSDETTEQSPDEFFDDLFGSDSEGIIKRISPKVVISDIALRPDNDAVDKFLYIAKGVVSFEMQQKGVQFVKGAIGSYIYGNKTKSFKDEVLKVSESLGRAVAKKIASLEAKETLTEADKIALGELKILNAYFNEFVTFAVRELIKNSQMSYKKSITDENGQEQEAAEFSGIQDMDSVLEKVIFSDSGDLYINQKETLFIKLKRKLNLVKSGDTFGGLSGYLDFDETFNLLKGKLAGLEPSLDLVRQAIRKISGESIRYKHLLNAFDQFDKQTQIQLVVALTGHYNNMREVVFMQSNYMHGSDVVLFKSNKNAIGDRILDAWAHNFALQPFIQEHPKTVTLADGTEVDIYEKVVNLNVPINKSGKTYRQVLQNYRAEITKAVNEERAMFKAAAREAVLAGETVPRLKDYLGKNSLGLIMDFFNLLGIEISIEALDAYIQQTPEHIDLKTNKIKKSMPFLTLALGENGLLSTVMKLLETDLIDVNKATPTIGNNALRELAKIEGSVGHSELSITHKDGHGNLVSSFELDKHLHTATNGLLHSEEYRKYSKQRAFSADSFWVRQIESLNGTEIKNRMDTWTASSSRFAGVNNSIKDLTDMTEIEVMSFQMAAFFGEKYTKNTKKDAIMFGSFLMPAFADKSVLRAVVAPTLNTRGIKITDGKVEIPLESNILDELYLSAMSEIRRVAQHKSIGIKGYDEGGSQFILFKAFYEKLKQLQGAEKAKELVKNEHNGEEVLIIKDAIKQWVEAEINETASYWKSSGLNKLINSRYIQTIAAREVSDSRNNADITAYAAADFIINHKIAYTEMFRHLLADPAIFWKKDYKSTLDNMSKRFAAFVAHGHREVLNKKKKINTLVVKDTKAFIPKVLHSQFKKLGLKTDISASEATDSMQIETWEERLYNKLATGRMEESEYLKILNAIKKGEKIDPMLAKAHFGITKPVYAGMRVVDGVNVFDYIKTASIALLPQFTDDNPELKKFREFIEDKKNNIDRVVFESAYKTGAPTNAVELFDENRKFIAPTKFEIIEHSRENYRIQMDIPYKHKEITITSQGRKLQFVDLLSTKGFKIDKGWINEYLKGKFDKADMSGSAMHDVYMQLVAEYTAQGLATINDLILDENGELDMHKLQALLLEEASKRNWNLRDIFALNLGTIDNRLQFSLPLFMNSSGLRVESLIMSIIDKNIRNNKTNGHGFTLSGDLGFGLVEDSDLRKESLGITYVEGFNSDTLLSQREENGVRKGAQVIMPFKFKVGNVDLSIDDFIVEKEGKRYIDTEKLPKEILETYGYRIPFQRMNSGFLIEVVGFHELGDFIIAPSSLVNQVGHDFDADKLYVYAYNLSKFKKGKKGEKTIYERFNYEKEIARYRRYLNWKLNKTLKTGEDTYTERELAEFKDVEIEAQMAQFGAEASEFNLSRLKALGLSSEIDTGFSGLLDAEGNVVTTEETLETLAKKSALGKLSDDEKSYEFTFKAGTSEYTKEFIRLSDFIGSKIDKYTSLLGVSQNVGTGVDDILRDFFKDGVKEINEYHYKGEPLFSSKKAFNDYVKELQGLKNYFDSRGETVITDKILLYSLTHEVAGTPDIVTYDAEGNFRIYDLKTLRPDDTADDFEAYALATNKKFKWTKQVNGYGEMFTEMTGKVPVEYNILPLRVAYTGTSNKIQSLEFVLKDTGYMYPLEKKNTFPKVSNLATRHKKNKRAPKVGVLSTGSVKAARDGHLKGDGVFTLRVLTAFGDLTPDKHYGNPFTSNKPLSDASKAVTFMTSETEEGDDFENAVRAYKDWLKNDENLDKTPLSAYGIDSKLTLGEVQPQRRRWILNQIESGELDGVTLLYHNRTTKTNHAEVLRDIVNSRKAYGSNYNKNVSRLSNEDLSKPYNYNVYLPFAGKAEKAKTTLKALGIKNVFLVSNNETLKNQNDVEYRKLKGVALTVAENDLKSVEHLIDSNYDRLSELDKQDALVQHDLVRKSDSLIVVGTLANGKYIGDNKWAVALNQEAAINKMHLYDEREKAWYEWQGDKGGKWVKSFAPVVSRKHAILVNKKGDFFPDRAFSEMYKNTFQFFKDKTEKTDLSKRTKLSIASKAAYERKLAILELQNRMLDITKAMYANNSDEVQKRALDSLENATLEEEVDKYEKLFTFKTDDLTSPTYWAEKTQVTYEGKDAIGIFALASTFNYNLQVAGTSNEIREGKPIYPQYFVKEGDETKKVKFDLTLKEGKKEYKTTAFSDNKSIRGLDKSYTFMVYTNEAVDDIANGRLKMVNVNKHTFKPMLYMLQAGLEKDVITAMLMSPVILDYINELRDLTKPSNANKTKKSVTQAYLQKLRKAAKIKDDNFDLAFAEVQDNVFDINKIKKDSLKEKSATAYQNYILFQAFRIFDDLGGKLGNLQVTLNADSSGIGKNMIDIQNKYNTALNASFFFPNIANVNRLVFEAESTEPKPGYIKTTKQIEGYQQYVKPANINAFFTLSLGIYATEKFDDISLENYPLYKNFFENVLSGANVDRADVNAKNLLSRKVKNFLVGYINSLNSTGLYAHSAVVARHETFKGENSLGKALQDIKENTTVKNNVFLNSLRIKHDTKQDIWEVTFDDTRGKDINEEGLIAGLHELIEQFPYLKSSFIEYFYSTGGIQNSTKFGRFILPSLLPESYFRAAHESAARLDVSQEHFVYRQFYQHFPDSAKAIEYSDLVPVADGYYTLNTENPKQFLHSKNEKTKKPDSLYELAQMRKDENGETQAVYVKIPLLGKGQSVMEIDPNARVVQRSLFDENNAGAISGKISLLNMERLNENESLYKAPSETEAFTKSYLKDLKISENSTTEEVLLSIAEDADYPLFSLLANAFAPYTYKTKIELKNNASPRRGFIRYNPNGNRIYLNVNSIDTKKQFMATLIHELTHDVTADAINNPENYSEAVQKSVRSLKAAHQLFVEAVKKDPANTVKLKEYNNMSKLEYYKNMGLKVASGEKRYMEYRSEQDRALFYPIFASNGDTNNLAPLREFAVMVTQDEHTAKFANEVEFTGKISLLARIQNLLKELLTHLGIDMKKGSVLEASLNAVFHIAQNKNVNKGTESDTRIDAIAELTRSSIITPLLYATEGNITIDDVINKLKKHKVINKFKGKYYMTKGNYTGDPMSQYKHMTSTSINTNGGQYHKNLAILQRLAQLYPEIILLNKNPMTGTVAVTFNENGIDEINKEFRIKNEIGVDFEGVVTGADESTTVGIEQTIIKLKERRRDIKAKIDAIQARQGSYYVNGKPSPLMQSLRRESANLTLRIKRLRNEDSREAIIEVVTEELAEVQRILDDSSIILTAGQVELMLKNVETWEDLKDWALEQEEKEEGYNLQDEELEMINKVVNVAESLKERLTTISLKLLSEDMKTRNVDISPDEMKLMRDIAGGSAYLGDATVMNNPLIQRIGILIKETSAKIRKQFLAFSDELEELWNKAQEEADRKGIDLIELLEERGLENQPTGNLTSVYDVKWYMAYDTMMQQAKDTKSWKAFKQWEKERTVAVDPRIFFPELVKGALEESEQIEGTLENDPDVAIGQLKLWLGDAEYEKTMNRAKLKLKTYLELKAQKKEELFEERKGELTLDEAQAMFNTWLAENSPFFALNRRYGSKTKLTRDRVAVKGGRSVIKVPKKFIQGRATGYYSNAYEQLQNTDAIKSFYNFAINALEQMYLAYPADKRGSVRFNAIPHAPKAILEALKDVKGSKELTQFWLDKWQSLQTEDDPTIVYEDRDKRGGKKYRLQGKYLPVIPNEEAKLNVKLAQLAKEKGEFDDRAETKTRLRYELRSEYYQQQSRNFPKVLEAFALGSFTYQQKAEIEDLVLLYNRAIQNAEGYKEDGAGNILQNRNKGIDKSKQDLPNLKKAADYNVAAFYGRRRRKEMAFGKTLYNNRDKKRKLEIEQEIKDLKLLMGANEAFKDEGQAAIAALQKERDNLGQRRTGSAIGSSLLNYVQIKTMGWNVLSAITNMGFGAMSNMIHAAGGEDFGVKSYLTAQAMMLNNLAVAGKVDFSYNDIGTKIGILGRFYDVVKEVNEAEFKGTTLVAKVNSKFKALRALKPYKLQGKSEVMIQTPVMIAMMLENKIDLQDGTKVSMWEAYDKNGKMREDAIWTDEMELAFKLKLDQILKRLHGNYDPDAPVLAKSYVLGRASLQFRSWVYEGWQNRMELGDKDNEGEYIGRNDMTLGRRVKGRYVTLWQFIKGTSFVHNFLTPEEKKRLESGETIKNLEFKLRGRVLKAMFTKNPKDVDIANMRKNLMELSWWVALAGITTLLKLALDDEDEEKKRFLLVMLNSINRVQDDIEFYLDPTTFEKITKNFLPVMAVMSDALQVMGAFFDTIQGEGEYKTGWLAGKDKLWYRTSKMVPFANNVRSLYGAASTAFK